MNTYKIPITPVSAPRQTRKDKWNPSLAVQRYRAFAVELTYLLNGMGLDLRLHSSLTLAFGVPIPSSWSNKKKKELLGGPHQQKPDLDNLCKAVLDAARIDDSHVHSLVLSKVWSEKGFIEIKTTA